MTKFTIQLTLFGLSIFNSTVQTQRWIFEPESEEALLLRKMSEDLKHLKGGTSSNQDRSGVTVHNHGGSTIATLSTAGTYMNIVQQPVQQAGATQPSPAVAPSSEIPLARKGIQSLGSDDETWFQRLKRVALYPWNTLSSWWNRSNNTLSESSTTITGYVATHKKELAFKGLVAGYVYINYRLFRLAVAARSPQNWSSWKSHLNLSQLLEQPQRQVAAELISDVRRRYSSLSDVTTSSVPFNSFMHDLEEESQVLTRYQTLAGLLLKVDAVEHRWFALCAACAPRFMGISGSMIIQFIASKISIRSLFYIDEQLLQAIPDRLSRLAYLKNLFVQWIAEFNVHRAQEILESIGMGGEFNVVG